MTDPLHTYYADTISEALHELDVKLTSAQIDHIADAVLGSRENEGMATGRDCIPHPLSIEVRRLEDQIKTVNREADERDRKWAAAMGRVKHLDGNHISLEHGGDVTYSNGRTHIIA